MVQTTRQPVAAIEPGFGLEWVSDFDLGRTPEPRTYASGTGWSHGPRYDRSREKERGRWIRGRRVRQKGRAINIAPVQIVDREHQRVRSPSRASSSRRAENRGGGAPGGRGLRNPRRGGLDHGFDPTQAGEDPESAHVSGQHGRSLGRRQPPQDGDPANRSGCPVPCTAPTRAGSNDRRGSRRRHVEPPVEEVLQSAVFPAPEGPWR